MKTPCALLLTPQTFGKEAGRTWKLGAGNREKEATS